MSWREPTIMDKSLGTLLRFWGVFQFTQVQPLPSPHKQCWTRVSRIFSEIQLCVGWGEGELHENFENDAVLRGSREMTEKYAYCSTVPRTFVQDCSSMLAHTVDFHVRLPLVSYHLIKIPNFFPVKATATTVWRDGFITVHYF